MRALLIWIARLAGVVGLTLAGSAVAVRLAGIFWMRGYQTGTVFEGGMACVLMACLGYLAAIAETPNPEGSSAAE